MTPEESTGFLDQPITLGKKTFRGPFAIPSGIRCTRASTIEACFAQIPSLGLITTKSISLAPRAGYLEPIYARYAHDSYINAVGLSNPGAEQFRRELKDIEVPEDKFLLVSIFGGNTKQFVDTANALFDVADGFELNMSCPHAEGYGVEIGQKKDLVAEITAAVVKATGLPVIVKLSAVVGDVGQTAKAAIDAGAAGVTVTNTIGPATVNVEGVPILSNRVGGLSGIGIRPLALRSIKRVRDAIGPNPIIIGMGGVATAQDVREFHAAGANIVGIGSSLTGMDSERMREYFGRLERELRSGSAAVAGDLPQISMEYFPARVAAVQEYYPGLFKLVLDSLPIKGEVGELAGKYFFLTIPGVGEKPFAIFSAEEKSVVIKVVGRFTQYLSQVPVGSRIFLRGPYGTSLPPIANRTVVLVGGGTGIASLYEVCQLLKPANRLHMFLGGRSAGDIFELEKFERFGPVQVSTNDGSKGHSGFVTDLLRQWLSANGNGRAESVFILCGPEPMVQAGFSVLSPVANGNDILAAIEYPTSCGVGICGKCASPSGALTCIDGPFMTLPAFIKRNVAAAHAAFKKKYMLE